MKCPHCLTDFHGQTRTLLIGVDVDGAWGLEIDSCPTCSRLIVALATGETVGQPSPFAPVFVVDEIVGLVRPKAVARTPLPPEVRDEYAGDYREACLVLADSPKASAALSRRCLQHLLRDTAKVKPGKLYAEIEELLARGTLPSHISESLHDVREIGNIAAHPEKNDQTGMIVDVEPGEAEWNLDVLEMLFDFYFVAPKRTEERRRAFKEKLGRARKGSKE